MLLLSVHNVHYATDAVALECKQNSKSENTTANQKTQQQIRKTQQQIRKTQQLMRKQNSIRETQTGKGTLVRGLDFLDA
jgi:TolA-binding protein